MSILNAFSLNSIYLDYISLLPSVPFIANAKCQSLIELLNEMTWIYVAVETLKPEIKGTHKNSYIFNLGV